MEYIDKGNGNPVVLFSGTPSGSDHILLFEGLLDKFRIISPSRPGYLGTPLNGPSSITDQAWMFFDLLNKLNINKTSLLAHSGGGPYALEFVKLFPEKVDKLILCSALVKPDKIGLLSRIFWQNWILRLGGFFAPQYKAYLQLLMPKRKRIDGFNNDAYNFKNMPVFNFSSINCPTLILHDLNDSFVKFEQAQLANHIPKSILMTFSGNHFLTIGPDKDEVYEAMEGFLEK